MKYRPSEKLEIIKRLKKLGYGGYFGDVINTLESKPIETKPKPADDAKKKKKKEKRTYTLDEQAMTNWIDSTDKLFRNPETGLLEGEKTHREHVQSLYNSFMNADKHWLTKEKNSHETVPWSAATITNGIQAMYHLSDEEVRKALDPKNKGLYRHSTYINSSINAKEDGMFIASDIKNQNIGNMPIGSILFTGRGEAKNWDYDAIAKKAKRNSKYKAHGDFITEKGKDEIGHYVMTTGGNRKNPDDPSDESFVSKKLYYDPETGQALGFYNSKKEIFTSKGYYKGSLTPNEKYINRVVADPAYFNEELPQATIEAKAGEGMTQLPISKPSLLPQTEGSLAVQTEPRPEEIQRQYQDPGLTRAPILPARQLDNEIDRSVRADSSPRPESTSVFNYKYLEPERTGQIQEIREPQPELEIREPKPEKVEELPEVSVKYKPKVSDAQKAAYERYMRSKRNSNDLRNLDERFAQGGFIKTRAPQRYVGKAYQDRKHHAGFMEGDLNMYMAYGGPLSGSNSGKPKKKKGTVGIKATDSFMSNAYFNEANDGIPFKSNMGEIIDLNLPQPEKNNPIRFNPHISGSEKGLNISGNLSMDLGENLRLQGGAEKYYDFSPEAEESKARYNLGLKYRIPYKRK